MWPRSQHRCAAGGGTGALPAHEPVDGVTVDRLLVEQQLGEPVELCAVGREQVHGALLGLSQQARQLGVDDPLRLLRPRPLGHLLPARYIGL